MRFFSKFHWKKCFNFSFFFSFFFFFFFISFFLFSFFFLTRKKLNTINIQINKNKLLLCSLIAPCLKFRQDFLWSNLKIWNLLIYPFKLYYWTIYISYLHPCMFHTHFLASKQRMVQIHLVFFPITLKKKKKKIN